VTPASLVAQLNPRELAVTASYTVAPGMRVRIPIHRYA
jgi:hypothetical protein